MGAPVSELETSLVDNDAVCRGCLVNTGIMKEMFQWGLSKDFFKLTDITLDQTKDISTLLCPDCEEMLQKFKDFRIQCTNSNLVLKNLAEQKQSQNKQIATKPSQICEVNCKMFQHKLLIMITVDNDSKVELICPYGCSDKFQKRRNLFYHLIKTHSIIEKSFKVEMEYYCIHQNCSYHIESDQHKFFSGRKFLNQHYNKVHKSKIFHCDICSFKFSTCVDYNRHLKTCNKSFACTICSATYHTNESLLVHLKRRHPEKHTQYKEENRANKRKAKLEMQSKKVKAQETVTSCESPKRTLATQTLNLENIRNDVALPPWNTAGRSDEAVNEISTQTVFDDMLTLKPQSTEDCIYSEIHTQTIPLEFGLSRSNKETVTSQTQSDDMLMSIETQTCICHYDSSMTFRHFESVAIRPPATSESPEPKVTRIKDEVLVAKPVVGSRLIFEEETCKDDM